MPAILHRESVCRSALPWEIAPPDEAAAAEPGHCAEVRRERTPPAAADDARRRGSITGALPAPGRATGALRDDRAAGAALVPPTPH